ncbi:hypothetical protein Btru_026532 [Bulinus truncatus]|nr:hypothetical protein Btru_026532 [Bulinus truncatus]
MLMLAVLLCVNPILSASLNNLPLKDCANGDFDLVFMIDDVMHIKRVENIVTFFWNIRKNATGKFRVAVTHLSWRVNVIMPFKEIDSKTSKSQFIDTLNEMKYSEEKNSSDIFSWSLYGRVEAQNLTIEILNSEDVEVSFTSLTFETPHSQNVPTLVILLQKVLKTSKQLERQWFYKNVIFTDSTDVLQDMKLVYLSVCGKCSDGWTQHDTELYGTSCYKIMETSEPVNFYEAERTCSEYKSDLVNIETKEELLLVQKMFISNRTEINKKIKSSEHRIPLGLRQLQRYTFLRYQWSNGRPFLLGSNERSKIFRHDRRHTCVSMSVFNETINFNHIENVLLEHSCLSSDFYKVFLCEYDMLRTWTSFEELNSDVRANNESYGLVLNKTFSFDCGDDQYVHYYQVCDGHRHCKSGLDEIVCSVKRKLPYDRMWDLEYIVNKESIMHHNIFLTLYHDLKLLHNDCYEMPCESGQCLPLQWNNGDTCSVTYFEDPGFLCVNSKCLRKFEYMICDSNGSNMYNEIDHKNVCGDLNSSRCPVNDTVQWAPKCVYVRSKSGYPLGCPDLSHLDNCENFTCPDDMVKCPFSYCIQVSYVGDDIMDCRHGEDEAYLVHVGNFELKQYLTNTKINMELLTTNFYKGAKITGNLYTDNYNLCCAKILGPNTSPHVCHSPGGAISSCDDLLADKTKRVLLWIVAFVSLIGNVVVLMYRFVIGRDVLKLSYGVFITNLGISDLIMSFYLIIISSIDICYRDVYVLHETIRRYSTLCKTSGFLSTLSSETSTFFVLLITIDRFLAIRFPYGDYRFSKPTLIISVVLVWSMGFVIALIPIIFSDYGIYSSNGMCLGLPLSYRQEAGWTYAVGIFIILNFIVFTLVAAGQAAIYLSVTNGKKMAVQCPSRRKQDIDVAKQLCLITMSNFLCWFPVSVVGLSSMTGASVSQDTYAWIVVFVLPLNSAVNPNIYTIPFVYRKWKDFKRGRNNAQS